MNEKKNHLKLLGENYLKSLPVLKLNADFSFFKVLQKREESKNFFFFIANFYKKKKVFINEETQRIKSADLLHRIMNEISM